MDEALKIKFDPRASKNLANIKQYISKYDERAAQKTVEAIINVTKLLSKQPFLGPSLEGRTGRKSAHRYFVVTPNYIIIYTPSNYAIHINRIVHARQNWTKWKLTNSSRSLGG